MGSTAGVTDIPASAAQIEGLEDMDEELRQAVLLSLQDYCGDASGNSNPQAETQQAENQENNSEATQQPQDGAANGNQAERSQGDSAGSRDGVGN